jgi:hypothetical protein
MPGREQPNEAGPEHDDVEGLQRGRARRPRKRRENAHEISDQRRLLLDPRVWPGLSLPNLRATVGIVRLLWASAPCWIAWKAGTRVAYKSASVRFSTVESGSAAANATI